MLPPVPPNKSRSWELVQGTKFSLGLETRELSEMAVLSAIFVVTATIPISAFIGGSGFITLSIVIVPVIARILKPKAALICGLVGAVAVYALQIATAPIFGPLSLLIPTSGILLGSMAFHHRIGPIVPWVYVLFGTIFYVAFSGGGYLWLAPYVLALASLPLLLNRRRASLPLLCLYSTICELVTMNIASISFLRLPGPLWTVIAPFMFFERTVATLGSFLVIAGIHKAMPAFLRDE